MVVEDNSHSHLIDSYVSRGSSIFSSIENVEEIKLLQLLEK